MKFLFLKISIFSFSFKSRSLFLAVGSLLFDLLFGKFAGESQTLTRSRLWIFLWLPHSETDVLEVKISETNQHN